MLTNPYDLMTCFGVPISRLLTLGSMPVPHSVLNVKALVQVHRLIDLRHHKNVLHGGGGGVLLSCSADILIWVTTLPTSVHKIRKHVLMEAEQYTWGAKPFHSALNLGCGITSFFISTVYF